jgi:hypothetical protein
MRIGRLLLCDDVARLHVEIDTINDLLVGFCFIRSIDSMQARARPVNYTLGRRLRWAESNGS